MQDYKWHLCVTKLNSIHFCAFSAYASQNQELFIAAQDINQDTLCITSAIN